MHIEQSLPLFFTLITPESYPNLHRQFECSLSIALPPENLDNNKWYYSPSNRSLRKKTDANIDASCNLTHYGSN